MGAINTDPESLLIVGTGALATLFAARLAAVGVPVTLLGGWQAGLDALSRHGAQLEGGQAFPVRATANPNDCLGAKAAIVLVKSWQTRVVAGQLSACLAPTGVALTLQNGLGNDMLLEQALGPERVAHGVTTLGASLPAPGIVRLAGDGPVTLEAHPRLSSIERMLRQGGFDVYQAEDVRSLVWSKLVVSTAINPLTALLRLKNGDLLDRPTARALMGMVALETARVSDAQGIDLLFPDPVAEVENVAMLTSQNISSMLQDVLRGTQTEIDAINGAVVNIANRLQIPVPANQMIWSLVKAISVHGKI